MTKRHLVLGGCGFIGRHVALQLARNGCNVVIADRTEPAFKFQGDEGRLISWQRLEFTSADWDQLIENTDVVHHYIWMSIPASANNNPYGDLEANVAGTLALLEAMRRRGGGRIVFASSGGTVYGRLKNIPVREEHPLMPITAYGAGKAAAEIYLGLYRSLHGVDCRIARISNPYGAGQDTGRGQGAVTTFVQRAIDGQAIEIWGDGEVIRDYIYISDLAEALSILGTAESLSGDHTFNIGSGTGQTLNQILDHVEAAIGHRLEVRRERGRTFDVPASVLDISRARSEFGWEPRVSFAEGVMRTVNDLRQNASFAS